MVATCIGSLFIPTTAAEEYNMKIGFLFGSVIS